jgi:hypothetical protein
MRCTREQVTVAEQRAERPPPESVRRNAALDPNVRISSISRKKVRRKIRTDDVQTAEETCMAVTYYVALPFIRTDDGTAPGEAQECQSEAAAIRRAEGMSRDPANAGAVAFKRAGDPNVGEFSDAVVLKTFGDVPEDLSAL